MIISQLSRINAKDNINWDKEYLTFIPIDDCTFTFSQRGTGPLYYSIDSGTTWTSGTSVSVSSGIKVMWKGSMTPNRSTSTSDYTDTGIGTFSATGQFKVRGNIMSLLYDDDFIGKVTLAGYWWFTSLFENSTIASASKLSLPAITLAPYCYYRMFDGCTSLISVPKLPAMTLANSCYRDMFSGCTSLTTAPKLPSMTLANSCYGYMFSGCTSLTTAPELPATTLEWYCYQEMFSGCTSLTTAPKLPAMTLATGCYLRMFTGCTSLTTAPKLPAMTLATICYGSMFYGCTSLTTAPELPATEYVKQAYNYMFCYCPINRLVCLLKNLTGWSETWWLGGTKSPGVFVKNPYNTEWLTDNYNYIRPGWTVEDLVITVTATTETIGDKTVLIPADVNVGESNLTFDPVLSNGDTIRIKCVAVDTEGEFPDESFDFSGVLSSTPDHEGDNIGTLNSGACAFSYLRNDMSKCSLSHNDEYMGFRIRHFDLQIWVNDIECMMF